MDYFTIRQMRLICEQKRFVFSETELIKIHPADKAKYLTIKSFYEEFKNKTGLSILDNWFRDQPYLYKKHGVFNDIDPLMKDLILQLNTHSNLFETINSCQGHGPILAGENSFGGGCSVKPFGGNLELKIKDKEFGEFLKRELNKLDFEDVEIKPYWSETEKDVLVILPKFKPIEEFRFIELADKLREKFWKKLIQDMLNLVNKYST